MSNSTAIAFSKPIFASASLPVLDCINLMRDRESRAILVTDGVSSEQVVVGIFTESDLVRNFSRMRLAENRFLPIREVMSSPIFTLPVAGIAEARTLMAMRRIRTVPLVKRPGTLTVSNIGGMVHAFDIVSSGTNLAYPALQENSKTLNAVLVSHSPKYAAYLEQSFAFFRSVELIHLLDLDPELAESMAASVQSAANVDLWTIVDADHFSEKALNSYYAFARLRGHTRNLVFLLDEFLSADRVEKVLKDVPEESRPAIVKKPVSPAEWLELVGAGEKNRK